MLLKSSSTTVLGSLLSSLSDSPNNSNHTYYHETNSIKKHPKTTIPFYHTGPINLSSSFSCISSPISPSIASKGIRRAQSEGNLEGLAYGSCCNTEDHLDSSQLAPKKFSGRHPKGLMLQTIPSFSFYGSRGICKDEEEEEFDFSEDTYDDEREEQEKISQEISNRQPERVTDRNWDAGIEEGRGEVSRHQEMSLETGLGGDNSHGGGGGSGSGNGGHGGEFNSGDEDGRNKDSTEEYYRRMMEENPGNPLFMRNYAQFLYQSKGDLHGAEEYYSRAILADPRNGKIISQYAQLLWELHHDQDRALSYFERAVQASPEDSHVHAAYANFLWKMEDEEGCNVPIAFDGTRPYSHGGATTTAST